ncbi:hypothetical protein COJ87_19935 [Bacillus cereus]|uniref:DUF4145 domain-containing protein n=1 Tax=Bacillus cereus TaxID=1396 RepID=UPI000BEE6288|nr:DUF4145 domain-containing protein [Bacillus cereus]PEC89410.1 hypothetical protein CON02_20230 [Bacillus cereus]PFO03465.1 hypothetical protein COJ68_01600 [Bacillus cereus]PFO75292.1 hypothetical protein COJ87_19935 [Bacillus cereus]PGN75027.1 hypothetical protein CN963_28280 [Bacillus cereus]
MRQYCNKCKQLTKHKIIHEYSRVYTPENTPEMQIDYAKEIWRIMECCGCEEVSFAEIWKSSEDVDYKTGIPYENIQLYPECQENSLGYQKFNVLPFMINKIYLEAIQTFNKNLYFSSMVCLRTIIEAICANVGIEEGSIKQKIDKLFEKGFLTKQHVDILHEHRLMGNQALHNLQIPTREELVIAIKIIEHTLENIYEINYKCEELKFLIESRRNKEGDRY